MTLMETNKPKFFINLKNFISELNVDIYQFI